MTETSLCVGVVVRKDVHTLLVRQSVGHPLQHQWTIPWRHMNFAVLSAHKLPSAGGQ